MKIALILISVLLFKFDLLSNPLANLPSSPGETVAQIESMQDNSWLILGMPAADSVWGRARGRAYSPRMVYAADKKGVFLCGTGPHAYIKPDKHLMDDLWFYDIHAHKWICLYPGSGTPNAQNPLALKLDMNGLEVDSTGNAIPVSYLSHGYCNMTYNPDSSYYTIMFTHSPWWCGALPQRIGWLGNDTCNGYNVGSEIPQPKHVLSWDVNNGKWIRRFHAGAGPSSRVEGVVEYLPTIKKLLYKWGRETWLYDYAANSWTKSTAVFPHSGYDYHGCYDSKRNRVFVAKDSLLWYYDVASDNWITLTAANRPNLGASTKAHLNYDSVNDKIIAIITAATSSTTGVYVYDIESNGWEKVAEKFTYTKSGSSYDQFNGCYVPDLNIHLVFGANDGGDNGWMFAYRYKKNGTSASKVKTHLAIPTVTVSPNPVSGGKFSVTLKGVVGKNAVISLLDAKGKIVKISPYKADFKLNAKAAGVYLLRVQSGDVSIMRKIIVM